MQSRPDTPRADTTGRAILLTLITVGVFGVQDAVSKMLVQDYSPFLITMLRYWGFALFALVLVARQARCGRPFVLACPAGKCCAACC